jgi:HPt (histidine-containing phosphotransfer) domain-containing protein
MEQERGCSSMSTEKTSLDQAGLARRMSGSQELLDMFLDLFKNQFPDTLERLRLAVEQENCDAVMREAHTIKSLLQNFFVGELVRCIHDLEIAGRQLNRASLPATFLQFQAELDNCHSLLSELPNLRI